MPKRSVHEQESNGGVVVQLATRIPKVLYRRLKLYCVGESISIADFVSGAIETELEKQAPKQKKAS